VPELDAVLLSRELAEEIVPNELLGDRRSALREERRATYLVLPAQPWQARQQASHLDFDQQARNCGIVDATMRKEVLVLSSNHRIPNNGRDVLILRDPPVLRRQFDKRLAVDVINVADGRKFKTSEWCHVGQVGSVKIDVDCGRPDSGRNHRGANEEAAEASLPMPPV